MDPEVAQHFLGELRGARARVLGDAEAFAKVFFVFERLGRTLCPTRTRFSDFKSALSSLAERSPLARDIPREFALYHLDFDGLFELLREGRNSAVHEGALARYVANHAVALALILEDALMPHTPTIADVMVRGPVTAAPWHPISYVRQMMLVSSFSYLPVKLTKNKDEKWQLVSDVGLASYLREDGPAGRAKRLHTSLREAVASGQLGLEAPTCVKPSEKVSKVVGHLTNLPLLVLDEEHHELVGIVTAFDLL